MWLVPSARNTPGTLLPFHSPLSENANAPSVFRKLTWRELHILHASIGSSCHFFFFFFFDAVISRRQRFESRSKVLSVKNPAAANYFLHTQAGIPAL